SRNGIRVNGVSVREAALRAGDVVQVARFHIRYVDQEAAPAPLLGEGAEDDRTRMVSAPALVSGAKSRPDPGRPPTAPAGADADRTRVLAEPSTPRPGPATAPPPVAVPAPPSRQTSPARGLLVQMSRGRTRGSWGGRLLTVVILLALLVCGLTAFMMKIWG